MADRLWVALTAFALACGGAEDNGVTDWQGEPQAGSGGQAGGAAGGNATEAGAPQGGAPGAAGGSSGDAGGGAGASPSAGAGGSSGAAGASQGGAAQGGAGQAGGAGSGGKGGATSGGGGAGGKPVDDLEPKPAENCPGYVDVLVPVGTCLWVHGTFTQQSQACNTFEPMERKCATISATQKDLVGRFSEAALMERFDFTESGCPKQCN